MAPPCRDTTSRSVSRRGPIPDEINCWWSCAYHETPCGNRTRPRRQQALCHVVKDAASSLLRGQQIESLGKHRGVQSSTGLRHVLWVRRLLRSVRTAFGWMLEAAICVAARGFARYLIRCASRRLPSSAPFLLSA